MSLTETLPRRIVNPHQGDAVTFLKTSEETGGERSVGELEVVPGGKVTPHYHLSYTETFTVRSGQLTVHVNGVRHDLGPGDALTAEPGQLHHWANDGDDTAVAVVELRPGQPGFERALRVAYGLAADGAVLKNGMPKNPLHAALILEWGDGRLPGAYAPLERGLRALARFARRLGVERRLIARYAA